MDKQRRSLAHDLTDQGKWQLEHGGTERIVVLEDGETYSGAEGCTLQVITTEQAKEICEEGDADDMTGEPLATYNVDALPDLLHQLKEARQYVAKVAADHAGESMGTFASRRLDRMDAAIAQATGGEVCQS